MVPLALILAASLLFGAGAIKVLSPNGGEVLKIGGQTQIKWQSTGISGKVVIILYKRGIKHSVIARETLNTGISNWAIPANLPEGTDYRIRVRSLRDLSINDFSDRDFTIKK